MPFNFTNVTLRLRGIGYGLVSVHLIVTSQYYIETAKRIQLVFGVGAALGLSYTMF